MHKIVTTAEMRQIEQAADASGLSYDEMMTNAGASIASAILDRWPEIQDKRVLVLVGPGNNGGDGLVVARHLREAGARIELYLSQPRTPTEDANFARLVREDIKVTLATADKGGLVLAAAIESAEMIIDALLGTGIKLPLRGTPESILSRATEVLQELGSVPPIVAVDCPSGLDCDTGQISKISLAAEMTVTLAAAKPGLFEFPGAAAVGDLVVGSIGLPDRMPELEAVSHILADHEEMRTWLPDRPVNSHKGTFGRVIIVAGSINYPGAALLSGLGAYRSGAGLVTLAVPSSIQAFLVPALPEATWIALPHEMGVISKTAAKILREELGSADALLLGPGFSQETAVKDFLEEFFAGAMEGKGSKDIGFIKRDQGVEDVEFPPCVVDADGLKLLSQIDGWKTLPGRTAVLTPHPGEFAIMTGLSIDEIIRDRLKYARHYAAHWGHVIVLKGAYSIIAAPDGRAVTIPIATSALATAGTGDVLAGVIVALLGQGLDAFEAAALGAYIHAEAGRLAAESFGTTVSVIAGDIVDFLSMEFAILGAD